MCVGGGVGSHYLTIGEVTVKVGGQWSRVEVAISAYADRSDAGHTYGRSSGTPGKRSA
ncbi:hypothetical protein GCM10010255_21800 [Streptomyces coeruleofuscus]|uniref:Uncharacterized protein n=1 Tax=Streptomyces coeruleofuscus TaxID=66879 RepID=A0ABN3I0B5_9ACTN